jgi:hypothetical protein
MMFAIAVVGIAVAAWLIVSVFLYYNPQLRVDYQTYMPARVADGLHLTNEKRFEVWAPSSWLGLFPNYTGIHVALSREGSSISESKVGPAINYYLGCSPTNVKCFSRTTSKSQKYDLTLTYGPSESGQYDKLSSQTASFQKGNTWISIDISKDSTQTPISDQDWSDMIDSFVPAKLDGSYKVYHMYPGP